MSLIKIILEKYSRLINIETDIIKIINIFKNVYNYNIFIVYNNKFINGKENVPDKIIEIIHQRKIYKNEKITEVNLNGEKTTGKVIINPIVIDSDLLGAIIIIGNNIFDMESTSKIIKELIKKNL